MILLPSVLVKSQALSLQFRWHILAEIMFWWNLPSRFRHPVASSADCASSLVQRIACLSEKAYPSLLFVHSHLVREVLLEIWTVNVASIAEIARSSVQLSQSAKAAETRLAIGFLSKA